MDGIEIAWDHTPNTSAVVLTVVIRTWVNVGTIQVQEVATDVTVRSRRPIVTAATPTARGRRTEDAGVEEVVRKTSKFVSYWSSFSCACIIWICAATVVSWVYTAI